MHSANRPMYCFQFPLDSDGDPAANVYRADIASTPSISWIGYYSSVSVYGDSKGEWVDEETAPHPMTQRGIRRLAAENGWIELARASGKTCVILRLPGIYGPGRSAIDQLRAGKARRIFKPGQVTNRAHVEDIATATEAALGLPIGLHIFNVTDDLPAPPQDVIAYGAELLGVPCPPATESGRCKPLTNGAQLLCRKQKGLERAHQKRTGSSARVSNLCRRIESDSQVLSRYISHQKPHLLRHSARMREPYAQIGRL